MARIAAGGNAAYPRDQEARATLTLGRALLADALSALAQAQRARGDARAEGMAKEARAIRGQAGKI